MIKVLIIADDLTGAMDNGVQFSKFGIPTLVTIDTNIDFFGPECENIQVLALDTETRHMFAKEVYIAS